RRFFLGLPNNRAVKRPLHETEGRDGVCQGSRAVKFTVGAMRQWDKAPAPALPSWVVGVTMHQVGHRWGIPHFNYTFIIVNKVFPQGAATLDMALIEVFDVGWFI